MLVKDKLSFKNAIFLVENTDVEFSQIKTDDKSIISTTHEFNFESGLAKKGYEEVLAGSKINEMIHSHPIDGDPSPKDMSGATYWKQLPNQNITLKIYKVMSKKYVEYDQNGINKN